MPVAPLDTGADMEYSYRHLQAEMARMDVLLQRAVAELGLSEETDHRVHGLVVSRL